MDEAIADACARGYAELDPSTDLDGLDAAAKLAILCALAFGVRVLPSQIETQDDGAVSGAGASGRRACAAARIRQIAHAEYDAGTVRADAPGWRRCSCPGASLFAPDEGAAERRGHRAAHAGDDHADGCRRRRRSDGRGRHQRPRGHCARSRGHRAGAECSSSPGKSRDCRTIIRGGCVSALIGLQCHLCKAMFPAEATYVCEQCLGPLEPVYDYEAIILTRETIETPAEEPLALPRAAADHRRAADRLSLRLHAARAVHAAGRATGPQRALHQGRLGQSSDAVVQGPRRVGGGDARQGARASRCWRARRPATSPTACRRMPRGSAWSAACSSPTISRPGRCSARPSSARRSSRLPATTTM